MRIADKMTYDSTSQNLSRNRSDLAELQNKAALQKRVAKPSDDPLAASRVLGARTEVSSGGQFLKSIAQAKTFLEYSEQSLGELADIIMRAKELAISQANDPSANATSREVVATEVDQLFNQTVQIGNRKLGDRFLFAGFKTTKAPFDPQGNYLGDQGQMKISVQKEGSISMNMPGDYIFHGKQAGPKKPEIAAAEQTLENAEQLAPHDNRDGEKKPKQNSSSALRGPASLPQQRAGEHASAHARRDGEFEVGGPKSSENGKESVARPEYGASWNADGVNVFQVLKGMSSGLRTNDKASVQDSLDRLDEALSQVVLARSQLGSRVMTLASATESLQKGQVDAKGLVSTLEDVDMFELVNDLNKSENTLKASLSTSGKLIQPSLLDFLK